MDIEIKIKISEKDANRTIQIGSMPWYKATEKEKEEYAHLIGLFGTAVCIKLLNK